MIAARFCDPVKDDLGAHKLRTPEEIAAALDCLMLEHDEGDLWLFGYGSLMWKPELDFAESRPALLNGWHRRFCLWQLRYRGSRTHPGLMLALDRGGSCRGVAYRIPRAEAWEALGKVLRREITVKPAANQPRWLPARVAGARRPAIGFVVNRQIPAYVGRLPAEQAADLIATGCGHVGSCAEYLLNTVVKLQEHGIRDRNLWHLQALVAQRLAGMSLS